MGFIEILSPDEISKLERANDLIKNMAELLDQISNKVIALKELGITLNIINHE